MYAQVVVLTYQSPDIDSYTYEIPKHLEKQIQIGQLVQIPFGKQQPLGIVIETSNQSPATSYSLKLLSSLVSPQPLLLPYQIELLKWLSFYYIAPMVNCLEAMLPMEGLKVKRLMTKAPSNLSRLSADYPTIQQSNNSTIQQFLVLTPTINRIPETMAKFPKAKNPVVYHNELKVSEKFALWMKILSVNVDYIFGSRFAIFAPVRNLKEIIIFDEHNSAYKDERSPYFDTLTVAEKIAQLTGAEIKIIDPSPKITTYFNQQKKLRIPHDKHRFKIIDLTKERLAQNYSPLASETEEYLQRVAKSKKNALLFLNKKRESGYLFCKNCQEKTFSQTQPDTCPNCQSADIFFNSLNIYSLAHFVKKIVDPYPVNIIEQKQKTLPPSNSIDIATSSIFYSQTLKKYELVILTLADTIVQVADLNAEEKLFQTISSLKPQLAPKSLLVIQTYSAQSEPINWAASGNFYAFFKSQLAMRSSLSYPPFSLLIKLTFKGKNQEKTQNLTQGLAKDLKYKILDTKYKIPATLLGPFKPLFFHNQAQFNIIIKYKLKSNQLAKREKAVKDLRPILKNLKNVQITVEPESLN